MGAFPNLSRNVPFCPRFPLLSFLGPGTGKRGQTGTKGDISGQIGKRPHSASTPFSEALYADAVRRVNLLTLAFALYFPAFERLRSTLSLA